MADSYEKLAQDELMVEQKSLPVNKTNADQQCAGDATMKEEEPLNQSDNKIMDEQHIFPLDQSDNKIMGEQQLLPLDQSDNKIMGEQQLLALESSEEQKLLELKVSEEQKLMALEAIEKQKVLALKASEEQKLLALEASEEQKVLALDAGEEQKLLALEANSDQVNVSENKDVIALSDDEIVVLNETGPTPSNKDNEIIVLSDNEPTPSKRAKLNGSFGNSSIQSSNTPTDRLKILDNNYFVLVNHMDKELKTTIQMRSNLGRKFIDILIGMISREVQNYPTIVKELVMVRRLVLPSTISDSPSQIVKLVVEHDPVIKISRVLEKIFINPKPELTSYEKYEQQLFQTNFPAPAMIQILFSIGQNLVQKYVFSEIINENSMPKTPADVEKKNKIDKNLKPLLSQLQEKNKSYHFETKKCNICGFETESETAMSIHAQTLHICKDKLLKCGICPEFNTSGFRMHRHYVEVHGLKPLFPEEPPAKLQCSFCKLDFQAKVKLNAHIKTCKAEYLCSKLIKKPQDPTEFVMVNQWLWQRSAIDPYVQALCRRKK